MPSSCAYGRTTSRALRNPKSSVSWSRNVQRNSGTTQQNERAPVDVNLCAGGEGAFRRSFARRELDLPARAEAPRRQRERDRLAVGVEEEQERVVRDLRAFVRPTRDLLAVQEDADRVRVGTLPVLLRHPPTVGPEPPDIGEAGPFDLLAGEEGLAPEHRVRLPDLDHALRELEEVGICFVPAEPGDLAVLAPRVVVAALRAPELVAAEDHRRPLGEQQRRQEVALLTCAQLVDLGVVGLALGAVVPRAVVIGAVLIVLAVRLVVLVVVRDEIAQREAVVRSDEVDRRKR